MSGDMNEPGYGGFDFWAIVFNNVGELFARKRFGGSLEDISTRAFVKDGSQYLLGYSKSPM